MNIIAHIHTPLASKFGVPRQSGLVNALKGYIVFTPEYRVPEALRGLDDFSHIWLIWEFSLAKKEHWSPTVRPPRLGGNTRMGVFATRSPFRPNSLGLSCVRLEKIEFSTPEGPVLYIAGADLMNGTPIFDIKPYIPYADCRPEASAGFTAQLSGKELAVHIPSELADVFSLEQLAALKGILAQNPRPGYHRDEGRVYGMTFAGRNVRFRIEQQCVIVESAEKDSGSST